MQQSVATVQRSSTSEIRLLRGDESLPSRLLSTLMALGLKAASILVRIFERFDSGISDSIDIDRASTRLAIVQRARSDGKNECPPSGEESISGAQQEIISHFKELQRRAQRRADILADKPRRVRERIDLPAIEGALQDIPSRCENDVHRMLAEWQCRLNSIKSDAVERAQRRSREKETESKATEQNIPAAFQLLFLAGLVGGAAFLVSKTPAFELGAASLVPPVWTFAVLLVVVVVSSVTARAVTSSISHHGPLWKLRKWLRAGTGIAFLALISVFASHYLLAMAASSDTGLLALFRGLLVEQTAPLLTFEDWTTFYIVLAAALITFIVCYQPDTAARKDETPHDEGRRTRKERKLLIKQLRKVNLKVDRAEADVTATLKETKVAVGKYARLVDDSRRLSSKLGDYNYVLGDACNILLDRYRAENIKVRTTQAPHSFQEHVCFRAEYEASSSTTLTDEKSHLDELQQGVVKLESQAGQIRRELRELNSRAINSLEEAAVG